MLNIYLENHNAYWKLLQNFKKYNNPYDRWIAVWKKKKKVDSELEMQNYI